MFVISLPNFIPRYKMFLGIENFSKRKGWKLGDGNKFMSNYVL